MVQGESDFDLIFAALAKHDEASRNAAFAEHARQQRRAWLRLTPRQRLDWLWQAKLFAARSLQAAEQRRLAKTAGGAPNDDKP